MVRSKSTCPKWHFGQVGHGGKKTIWGFFYVKKTLISCNVNEVLRSTLFSNLDGLV
jgi:hypothetical protein